jgi:hypothetical protein
MIQLILFALIAIIIIFILFPSTSNNVTLGICDDDNRYWYLDSKNNKKFRPCNTVSECDQQNKLIKFNEVGEASPRSCNTTSECIQTGKEKKKFVYNATGEITHSVDC